MSLTAGRTRVCPVCAGEGWVDEAAQDLRAAGITPWGVTEEDFRSCPTHSRS